MSIGSIPTYSKGAYMKKKVDPQQFFEKYLTVLHEHIILLSIILILYDWYYKLFFLYRKAEVITYPGLENQPFSGVQ